jgi:hypothetical protein
MLKSGADNIKFLLQAYMLFTVLNDKRIEPDKFTQLQQKTK